MISILIYKSASQHHYPIVVTDDSLYCDAIKVMPKYEHKILWKKRNVSPEQRDASIKTIDTLVTKLNKGEKVDLKKELNCFFS